MLKCRLQIANFKMKNKIKTSILHFALFILHFELEQSDKSARGNLSGIFPRLLPFPIYFPLPFSRGGRGRGSFFNRLKADGLRR
jgi:hypothetical protein